MSKLIEVLIGTIENDLIQIKEISDLRQKRKEENILISRIHSAKKLVPNDGTLLQKLEEIEQKVR